MDKKGKKINRGRIEFGHSPSRFGLVLVCCRKKEMWKGRKREAGMGSFRVYCTTAQYLQGEVNVKCHLFPGILPGNYSGYRYSRIAGWYDQSRVWISAFP